MAKSLFGRYIKYLGENVDFELENMVFKSLPRGNNLVYLDVGCFDGSKTIKRAGKIGTKRIIGIDVLPSIVKGARKKGIKMVTCDLNKKWPLGSSSVDCITATEVVEHLVDIDNFFSEARRVLKPGGRLIITTDNLAGYQNIFALLIGNQPYTGPYLSKVYPIGHRPNAEFYKVSYFREMNPHLNVMTSKALEQLLTFYKFKIVVVKGAGFYPFPKPVSSVFSQIDKRHAAHIFMVGEK